MTEQDLLPKLPANNVIVMDNASFHQGKDMKQLIVNAGHLLEYLPPYSQGSKSNLTKMG